MLFSCSLCRRQSSVTYTTRKWSAKRLQVEMTQNELHLRFPLISTPPSRINRTETTKAYNIGHNKSVVGQLSAPDRSLNYCAAQQFCKNIIVRNNNITKFVYNLSKLQLSDTHCFYSYCILSSEPVLSSSLPLNLDLRCYSSVSWSVLYLCFQHGYYL